MHIPGVSWAWTLIKTGQTRFLLAEVWMRFYKQFYEVIFALKFRVFGRLPSVRTEKIAVDTKYPVAFESPDHLLPWGTMRDNSTNKKFVVFMAQRLAAESSPGTKLASLDIGCSGGQLVRDFRDLGWLAVGLEGSDFSLKHKRANWADLAGINLFTCDAAKPFRISADGQAAQFNLITMWEVLEHIPTPKLPQLFNNIHNHLASGGYFIASTTSAPDVHEGVDLHQTKWTNAEWRKWLAENYADWEWVELGLNYYQFVRHNEEESFLSLRKKQPRRVT